MTLNLSAYGMGLGLVMAGWMAGMIVGYAFSAAKSIGMFG